MELVHTPHIELIAFSSHQFDLGVKSLSAVSLEPFAISYAVR